MYSLITKRSGTVGICVLRRGLMLPFASCTAGLLAVLLVPAAAESLLPSGSLPELVRAVIAGNSDLAVRRAQLAAAEETDEVARSMLLPQVSVGASKTLEEDDTGNNKQDSSHNFNVALTQQVFNLPLWDNYRASEQQVLAAQRRFASAEQNMRLSVVVAWLDLQFADGVTRLTEARIDIAKTQLKRAQSFVAVGVGTKLDVLDAQARLAALRADLLQSQNDFRLVQDRLHNLCDMHGVQARLGEAEFPQLAPLGEWLVRVAQGSWAAAAAQAELASAQALVRAADRTVFPRLQINASSSTNSGLSAHREKVVLLVEQPIFTGGQVLAEARRTVANSAAARHNLQAVRRREELRARELHGRAAVAQSRRRALVLAETAAAAALSATVAGYEGGVRIAADVLDAEETLFDARLQLRQVRYNYLRNLAALHALSGSTDEQFIDTLAALFIPAEKEKEDV